MIIKRRKEPKIVEINSQDDLLSYINNHLNLTHPWVRFRDEISSYVDELICSDIEISHKKFYINHFNKIKGNHMSRYQIGFWTDRGYTKKDAVELIKTEQSKNGLKFSKKIKENPSNYTSINPTQVGYWIEKGYSKEAALEKVRERQITFSLEKCIKKYGKEKGVKIFNNRQEKWIKSRKKSLEEGVWDTSSQGSDYTSFKYLKETFGDEWINQHIKLTSNNTRTSKKYIKALNKINDNKSNLIDFIKYLSFDDLLYYNSFKIFNELLENKERPIDIWCKHNGIKFKNNKYGNQYWFHGHYLKSNGEFKIAKFLYDNKINFLTNKPYPSSKLCYDFYLIDYNLFVELTGMRDKDYSKKKETLINTPHRILWINELNELKQIINEKNN